MEGKFSYLSDEQVAAIQQFWNTFDPDHSSEGQKTFISLWNVLPEMYSQLRENLSVKGLAYEGMAYRKVAEDIWDNNEMDGLNAGKYLLLVLMPSINVKKAFSGILKTMEKLNSIGIMTPGTHKMKFMKQVHSFAGTCTIFRRQGRSIMKILHPEKRIFIFCLYLQIPDRQKHYLMFLKSLVFSKHPNLSIPLLCLRMKIC